MREVWRWTITVAVSLAVFALVLGLRDRDDGTRTAPATVGGASAALTVVTGAAGATAPRAAATAADPEVSVVAAAKGAKVDVFAQPGPGAPVTSLGNPVPSGAPLVFLVESGVDDWLHVYLPLRPNGSMGWIRAADVTLSQHSFRIEVYLAEYRLDVYQRGKLMLSAPIGVARDNAPTPDGIYYTTELLKPPQPNGPYGTFAYGLSGFSEVLTTFNGGPGQLGIHGTDDPASIGQKVSSGCIRLRNEDIDKLAAMLPLGVPVHIHA